MQNARIQRTNIYRILTLLAGSAACLILNEGQDIFIAASIALLAYLLVDIRRVSQFVQLDSIWVIAYLAIICGEGIFDAEIIRLNIYPAFYDAAARYINVINLVFLIGFNLIERFWPEHKARSIRPAQKNNLYLPILTILYLIFLFDSVPLAQQVLFEGRFQVVLESQQLRGSGDLISGFFSNIGMLLPAVLAYHYFFIRQFGKTQKLLFFSLSYLPVLLIQVAIGTRYPLIVSALSVLVIYSSRYPFGWLRSLKLVTLGVLALVVTTLMRELRGYGLETDLSSLNIGGGERFFMSEGVVTYFARMIDYFEQIGFRNGQEHLAVMLFWIPRILWPGKPTQLEYWFPRAYGESGFAEGHSIAATFAATAFADFGFVGACLIWALIGVGLGFLNRWATQTFYADPGNPSIVIASVLAGLAFFMVRQISTIIFTAIPLIILWWFYMRGLAPRKNSVGLPEQTPQEQVAVGYFTGIRIQNPEPHRRS
ncbi:O-antigen polymerase [Deinococcus hohokamensis]|uniref:O-antigen polymerase n=1 Tax=Deinococcus hohokamensis TaxID=309883 RepID=A0ABV9IDJ8_9DEIO